MNLLTHEKLGGEDRTEGSRTHSKLTTSRIYFTGLAAVASQLPLFSIQYFWYLELFSLVVHVYLRNHIFFSQNIQLSKILDFILFTLL